MRVPDADQAVDLDRVRQRQLVLRLDIARIRLLVRQERAVRREVGEACAKAVQRAQLVLDRRRAEQILVGGDDAQAAVDARDGPR